jgi:molybdopterin-guanine dinucleotide biosynthesis protein A
MANEAVGSPICTGVILAGGPASRFEGRPKGLECIDGIRIIDRVAASLRGATEDLLLVANHQAATGWLPGVRTVSDIRRGGGTLVGIHSALAHAGSAALIVAWDMPFVPLGLLLSLRRLGDQGFDVVVPESGSPRGFEPLCAYYSPACLPEIERCLEAGDLRAIAFFDSVRVAKLSAETVRSFGDPEHTFFNVNRPEDLALLSAQQASPTLAVPSP